MTESQQEKIDWQLFFAKGKFNSNAQEQLKKLEPPPWRQFSDVSKLKYSKKKEIITRWKELQELSKTNEKGIKRGQSFYISSDEKSQDVINAVNAAIYLRRPILVTGKPGSGKTSLAYAIAYELGLGNVLTWAINARTTLQNGLYRYDAIARLQDTQNQDAKGIGEYIKLGALGTAFLPSFFPRVLLIDEIDKCDLNLPNDLLNLFEEGEFEIEELIRQAAKKESKLDTKLEDKTQQETNDKLFSVYTKDSRIKANITQGKVSCYAFPIIIMTSNGERDFPPAFKRRCIRVRMPDPNPDALKEIVRYHFTEQFFKDNKDEIGTLVEFFTKDDKSENLATDQLLNIIYLLTREVKIDDEDKKSLKEMLCRRLNLID